MSARAEDIWRKFVDQMTDEEKSEVNEWIDKNINQRTAMYDLETFKENIESRIKKLESDGSETHN